MGRPSTLLTRSATEDGAIKARMGGRCAAMFSGVFDLLEVPSPSLGRPASPC